MKARIFTSLLILLVVLPPILLGGWLLELLALFVIVTATLEWMQNATGYSRWKYFLVPFIIIWTLVQAALPMYRTAIYAIGLIVVWSMPIFVESFDESDCFLTLSFMLIVSCAYAGIEALKPAHLYLLTICLANYGSDTGAFFFGRFFGKHKLAPRISPKKTWEGFFGGWFSGFVLSWLISMIYVKQLDWTINLLICITGPVLAALGDLCFSCFKRKMKIKDFSSFLPGHGGLLDRLDSLIMNLIFFNVLIAFA